MTTEHRIGVRIPKSTSKRVDKAVRALRREQPGIKWTRSTLVRVALSRYLAEEESRRGREVDEC